MAKSKKHSRRTHENSVLNSWTSDFKKYFITGLVLLLPLALTSAIVSFIFNMLTDPFADLVGSVFSYYGVFQLGFGFWSAEQVQRLVSKVLIFIFLISFTLFLGYVTRWFFFHYFLRVGDYIFKKIPFIRSVYKTCQDVIQTLFASKTNSFKKVVLVPFPNKESSSIGFITREDMPNPRHPNQHNMIAVFVPTTPNPTSGFLMMYKKEDVVLLNMKIEDAFKYIVSCGVLSTPISIMEEHP